MLNRNRRIAAFVAATVTVLACAPAFALPSAAQPTFDPKSINTAIVLTANAAAQQTALVASPTFTPSPTSPPSLTPSITPSPTATFIFILVTATKPPPTQVPGASGLAFDCQILSKTPPDNSHVPLKADFQMDWVLLNTGTSPWYAKDADYRYRSGAKLHKQAIYDLPFDVASGGQVDITVAMKGPDTPSTQSTAWNLKVGSNDFCRMDVTLQFP